MIIKLLEDNTVLTLYDDGSKNCINSTHSHNALNNLSKLIADAFPYKGAMEFTGIAPTSFDNNKGVVTAPDGQLNPSVLVDEVWIDTDISDKSKEVQTFCNIVWTEKYKRIYQIKTERGLI